MFYFVIFICFSIDIGLFLLICLIISLGFSIDGPSRLHFLIVFLIGPSAGLTFQRALQKNNKKMDPGRTFSEKPKEIRRTRRSVRPRASFKLAITIYTH